MSDFGGRLLVCLKTRLVDLQAQNEALALLLQETTHTCKKEPQIKFWRKVQSFATRNNRLTNIQRRAIEDLLPVFGLRREDGMLDLHAVFGRTNDLVAEIGFGMGASLITMAVENRDKDYIGIEVHSPGVGNCLKNILKNELTNLRIYHADAKVVLEQCVADGTLAGIQIFFPDPWHKKKHHKRRLVQADFLEQMRRKLRPGGLLHLATDWEHYAEDMMALLTAAPGYRNCFREEPRGWAKGCDGAHECGVRGRPVTKFEQRGVRLGHGVWDLVFERVS